ncbi:MAG TPA: aminomethyl-transferring glycine dehydrogenase subunit GcvPA [Terriglobia bacterium]|jgi:glycine dehydrogenase subunit 1|nr:aminomethyl-transferring glycine dehydrogenase subunit GcvPA [Terriglobia bacterium]
MRYLPNSDADRAAMLEAIGKKSASELFEQIPAGLRLRGDLRLPGPLSEPELVEFFEEASRESARDYVSLLGAGAYAHYRPLAIDALILRGEFLTSYTPYQAEISQGNLQAMFEFQTLITQLTGMEVANSSLYDGSTAANEAVLMAMRLTRRERVVIARTVHPEYRQVIATYQQHQGVEIEEAAFTGTGQVDLEALEAAVNDRTAAVVVQSPNFFGALEAWPALAEIAHRHGALLVSVVTEPLSLALVKPPAEADIVCGEAQSFGVPVAFGGPYVGFLATREQYIRQMPGRLVGETKDTQGRRGYCLTLATREQHIRREKATSNICTSQSLMALNATIYLCLLGRNGLRALAEQNLAKACYAAAELAKVPGASLPFSAPHFNEFVIKAPVDSGELLAALREEKIIGGLPLERFYPDLKDHLLVCVTETVPRRALDRMTEVWHRFSRPAIEPAANEATVRV